jgi:translation initiation factor IF-2
VAVRIYSLAKELKLDSKELVDLCARAGIQDKGSALASLSDEEVSRVKEFIAGKSKTAERPAATRPAAKAAAKSPGVMRREDYVAPTGAAGRSRPQELKTGKPAPKPAPLGRAPSASAAASGRDDAGTEGGDAGPPLRVRPGMGRSSRTGAKPAPRPTFKLPPLPAAGRKPTAPPPSQEPAAQKPDVKLPLDAIRSAKAGGPSHLPSTCGSMSSGSRTSRPVEPPACSAEEWPVVG